MRVWTGGAATLATVLLLCVPAAAELKVGGFMDDWDPRYCYKPIAPFIPSPMGAEYDVRAYNQYIDSANTYISCIEQEAASTLKKAREVIQRKLDDEALSVKTQASAAKSAFDMSYRTR